ncbi:MAG: hypothetical protein COU82_00050 [Candidatus Portnoybacteria bacterium CG10_big_fil_rev_8_21_14_0_10_38_18]|uniref:Uncharacterized protein n=1 Tax=Candidatus Portnoybacteria bacterium CG10_big_fil_rev_8_21_14_0_10_38_18 TaxID=1974813 RepID=A0A2M8KCW4_9BACT|nr:MAG: hypothetical protein COU82_00050 [Candidatus Portnoybacteria bacterium CG10_big_fil_rev_8_21_14_0_10_38_18]
MQLIFKIKPAKEHGRPTSTRGGSTRGRSGIEIVLKTRRKLRKQAGPSKCVAFVRDTDNLLLTLDKLLKRNKIELESLKNIKLEIDKGAGLTSTRIVSAITKALSLDL